MWTRHLFFKTEGHQRTPYAFLVFFKLVFLCPPVSSIYSTGVTVKCNCLCFYGIYTCAIHELPRKILQVSNAQCLKMTEMSKKKLCCCFLIIFWPLAALQERSFKSKSCCCCCWASTRYETLLISLWSLLFA